jgi:predicted RNA-binding protein YlxR (DUF448 family)
VLDSERRMPGRGAYLCADGEGAGPASECLATALHRNAIGRALRSTVSLDDKLVNSVGR